MLVSLEIKNFLLIKKISINFINGFNAFTGETGAGKSIIIEGLKLALGGKNQTNLNLKENEISSIKAVFEINNLIKKNLDELNLIIEDDYLIVERQINSNQKSKLLVNGEIKPLNNIKGILKNVIEFQENFEQQELFDNKYFLKFIDNIGGIEKNDLKSYFEKFKDSKNIYQAHLENEKNININDYSIGIELENKGHNFGYTDYSKKQYHSLKRLIFFLKNNFFILNEDIIFHSDIAPNRKEDPGEWFFANKIGIKRFNNKKRKKKYSIDEMLKLYGFHTSYIKNYKRSCIMAVKRSLNYSVINPSKSKKFVKDFYNLLFS